MKKVILNSLKNKITKFENAKGNSFWSDHIGYN